MTSHVLNNSGALGKQTAPGVYLLQANLHHYQTIASGLARFPVAEGVQIDVLVAPSNDLDNSRWAVMSCSYSSANGGQLTRVYTTEGSNGTGHVDNFYTTDQSIKIIAINDGSQLNRGVVKMLDFGEFRGSANWGTFTIDHSTTIYAAATAGSFIHTPISATSILRTSISMTLISENDGTLSSNFESRVQMNYFDGSGTPTVLGDAVEFGLGSIPTPDTNMQGKYPVTLLNDVSQSEVNASGDWEIKPFIRIVDADTFVSLADCTLHWMELEK